MQTLALIAALAASSALTQAACALVTGVVNGQTREWVSCPSAVTGAGTTRCVDEGLVTLRNGANAGNVGFNLQSEIATSNTTVHIGSWRERVTF